MGAPLIIVCSVAYLLLLFGIAYVVEQKRKSQSSFLNQSWVYALSLAVYCTAWTYYGSVGRAVSSGPEFLTIYIGPSIMCALFLPVLRKIIIICKTQRITSIADLISNRYGKNYTLGILVTLFCIIGVLPYIAIQLKAISTSLHIITGSTPYHADGGWSNDTFVVAGILCLFIIIFGTRSADASERHEGLVATIAFESIVKLIAFLILGISTCYFLFDGVSDISRAAAEQGMTRFFTLHEGLGNNDWFAMILVSGLAMIFLPRQFQVAVVENTDVRHLNKATWMFPLYLLLINFFVLPLAMSGHILLGDRVSADAYVLALPLSSGHPLLGLLIYIGGFSAASGMIIVETIALSTMVSNNLILPLGLVKNLAASGDEKSTIRSIIFSRRAGIIVILLLACFYDKWIAASSSLVSIGLISMAAVAQFAPAAIGGLYIKWLTRKAAISAISAGFFIWFVCIVVPSIVNAGFLDAAIVERGFFGIEALKPTAFLGIQHMGVLAHGVFWSLLVNTGCLLAISLFTHPTRQEEYQSELFVHIERYVGVTGGPGMWKLSAKMESVTRLLSNFLGRERAQNLLHNYAQRHRISLQEQEADPRIIDFSEKILTGVIGSASARLLITNIAQEEEISIDEVMSIVRESQQVLELNKELKKKSLELSKAKQQLTEVNEQLMKSDVLKDEFLYTVTHELRTPLTSIRAMSEILYDNPEMEEEQRQFYLEGIVKEIERLSHLITQVLNLERYESGRQKLNYSAVDLGELIAEVIRSLQPLANEKAVSIQYESPNFMTLQQCDRDLIRQVIYNLISNAIKFVPEQEGRITVTCRVEEHEIQVWVADNGKGIAPELRELIFDKFFQAKNQTLQKPVGSGLGLAICKRIVEMHGGRIFVDGLSPQGAKFVFSLPVD